MGLSALFLPGDGGGPFAHGEDHVEVFDRRRLRLALLEPPFQRFAQCRLPRAAHFPEQTLVSHRI
jgi:hypothetical protein